VRVHYPMPLQRIELEVGDVSQCWGIWILTTVVEHYVFKPFTDEAQTAFLKDPVRTAQ